MELRNGSLVGGSPGVLPSEARQVFEEGVRLILHRWTALVLAVENEWGGRESRKKADEMYEDILAWFYDHKEHYADDLEVDLEEIMTTDFNVEIEDESCRLVAKDLVTLHNDMLQGDLRRFNALQQSQPVSAQASQQQARDSNGALLEDGDSESSSDEDEEMGEGNSSHQAKQVMQQGPVIDDDGFQLVQTKGRKR